MGLGNKQPKHPHPKDMGNGQFGSEGGLEMYKLLWGLQGRLSRVEAAIGIGALLLAATLTKLMEVW